MTDIRTRPMTKRRFILLLALWTLGIGVSLAALGWWLWWISLLIVGLVLVGLGVAWLGYVLVAKEGDPISAAYRRYMRTFIPAMGGYLLTILALTSVPRSLPLWAITLVALLPVLPMALVVMSMWRLTCASDELKQRIQREAVFITCGVVGLLAFAVGMLEMVGIFDLRAGLIYVLPVMFLVYGMANWWCRRKYGVEEGDC